MKKLSIITMPIQVENKDKIDIKTEINNFLSECEGLVNNKATQEYIKNKIIDIERKHYGDNKNVKKFKIKVSLDTEDYKAIRIMPVNRYTKKIFQKYVEIQRGV